MPKFRVELETMVPVKSTVDVYASSEEEAEMRAIYLWTTTPLLQEHGNDAPVKNECDGMVDFWPEVLDVSRS